MSDKSSQDSDEVYIAFDGEFSGPFNPEKYYMVALGAYAVSFNKDCSLKKVDDWYGAMTPPTKDHTFEKNCKEEFWDKPEQKELLEKFEKDARSPERMMKLFTNWLDNIIEKYEYVSLVCDCCEDSNWLNYYIIKYTDKQALIKYTGKYTGWPNITDDYYRGLLGTKKQWGLTDMLLKKFSEIKKPEPSTSHHPREDAREIVELYAPIVYNNEMRGISNQIHDIKKEINKITTNTNNTEKITNYSELLKSFNELTNELETKLKI